MLIKGDCLQEMKNIETDKIDLLFCDLPWGGRSTSCKWDCALDLPLFWKEVNRVCKINCPMFFCCNAKFGNTLINSNPKNFRYDLVWVKSAPVGFLNAKRMPMKKHELIYVFYRKLPMYDLSSHKHKFLGDKVDEIDEKYKNKGGLYSKISRNGLLKNETHYDPPLPTSIIKDDLFIRGKENNSENKDVYNYNERLKNGKLYHHARHLQKGDESIYDPPLPTSVIKTKGKEDSVFGKTEHYSIDQNLRHNGGLYDPPLPTSIIKEKQIKNTPKLEEVYGKEYLTNKPNYRLTNPNDTDAHIYEPPLPNSLLEIKSEKGKHQTQKPVKLIEWILTYYSKEGDTVLDPTMGSGSSGVACVNMNRKYIVIEMDDTIFKVAESRV